ncbi:flagellar hook-length control protein FliK [Pseudoteredinibacter isoporae]|uniref:Flagellar hook-length control protein-like C-terminal domain-containing protein n=1 Tax=Pseudoteredinibacter isoporae TaxID=570281 RepID=A0A7X0JVW7_9GAMM|nr:flagellar hook-length control protein FliK [Pseudoteredinibacter isoporae]MBB6523235.1 hypothetical protein [Pseudoteredinibacter isoporae]NHO88751.1 flagellar hook-length control protein FliK [Pseudoteredinibacter isoporae]NIB22558.1 flagellar hook-length control protein FliK [Pseudoteredinibacter isoporae]
MVIAQAPAAQSGSRPALETGASNSGSQASNDSLKQATPHTEKSASNPDTAALNQAKQEVLQVLSQKADGTKSLENALKNLEAHNKAHTVNGNNSDNTLDKQLFKRLPTRLQGLFALGLISDKRESRAQVIASALASARQVQQLLPLLQQGKSFTSADFIRQPPTLLKLELNGGHQLVTVSREPLAKGDWVNLRLDTKGNLKVSTLLEAAKTAAIENARSHDKVQGKLPLPPQPQITLQKALRESLPQQQSLSHVLGQVRNLSHNLAQLPKEPSLFSASSRLLIDQLADKLPTLKFMSHGSGIKQAISQSGVTQEAKLAKLAKEIADIVTPGVAAKPGSLQTGSLQQSTALAPALNDVKTLLGRLAQAIRNDVQLNRLSNPGNNLPSSNTASSTGTTSSASSTNPINTLNSQVSKVLELLLNPQGDVTAKTQGALQEQFKQLKGPQLRLLREHIKQKLLNLSQAGLAKVQTQQLHMLSEPANGVLQRWLMELPFSHQGEVRSVELEIQKREAKKKTAKGELQNQWQLRLNIDLQELGNLQADIKLIAERGNIQLWFAKAETLQLAQAKLDTLRQTLTRKGLELEELRCHQGIPPKLETSLQFQLINTRA